METLNLFSVLILTAGWGAALIWSARTAFRTPGWKRGVHALNALLMVAVAGAILARASGWGMVLAAVLMGTTLLVAQGDKTDPWRWLLMLQFIFALFVASGTPFRMLADG